MLHPSYTDLMQVVNKDVEEGETSSTAATLLYWQHQKGQDS